MSILVGNPFFLDAGAGAGGAYEIERSLRFNSSDSAYLSRTPASAGNRKTWTWAGWVKRSAFGNYQYLFCAGASESTDQSAIRFNNDETIDFFYFTGSFQWRLNTTQVFRDPSSWYHIVAVCDTDNATANNRARLYVNGSEVTVFATRTNPASGSTSVLNNNVEHRIGVPSFSTSTYQFSGYLADIHFIDGQALTPSSFTEVSATTGQLIPKAYTGSFGTNGFWLKFSDNSSNTATTLGKDYSGNSNNWTPNNFSVSEGITSVAAATGALPIYNTTDTYGTVKGSGTRTDSFSSSLVLALAMDGANNGTTFTDLSATIKGSGSAKSITVNGTAKTVTSDSKFYGSSAYFDGSTASLSIPDSADWAFGSGEFCIEFWAKGSLGILSFGQGEGGSPAFSVPYGEWYVGPSIWSFTFSIGTALPSNQWYHYAVVRSGNTINFYIDGIRYGSHSYSSSWPDSSSDFTIGLTRGIGFPVYVQDFRVYKGTAKYTANFNPPSATQIPAVAAGNDSLVDTPTSYGTDTGAGGEVRGNYCTWNPLDNGGSVTLSNGNLDITTPSSGLPSTRGTFAVSSGKWFYEFTVSSGAASIGFLKTTDSVSGFLGSTSGGYAYYSEGASYTKKINNNIQTDYGASFVAGDVIGVALDLDAGTITFYKNGASQGQAFSGLSGTFAPAVSDGTNVAGISGSANFGQRAFAYTAPSGFKALCDTNLPTPTIAKPSTVMDVKLWTGNAPASQTITGLNFSPDFVWIKNRSSARSHAVLDIVRGGDKVLSSDTTSAEATASNFITAFTSDGFTVGSDSDINGNSNAIVGWTWDAGSSTVTNTQGSITSSVRANASAGFSIVTYTGNGSTAQTIGHGLGVAPGLIIAKRRSAIEDWAVYHSSLGGTKGLSLNSTAAASTSIQYWSDTNPTSTLFTVHSNTINNGNGSTYVAYCFAPVAGYSSFGSYTGNGSTDGPFVYTGHRSRWILFKRYDSANGWVILDAARNTYNYVDSYLEPNTSSAEFSGGASGACDFLSNGFKVRSTGTGLNASGGSYIYFAVAENPFQYARAR